MFDRTMQFLIVFMCLGWGGVGWGEGIISEILTKGKVLKLTCIDFYIILAIFTIRKQTSRNL